MRMLVAISILFTLTSSLPAQQNVMKFNMTAIRDPMVDNIEGATLLVPEGWQVRGGFQWMPTYLMQANLLIQIGDPISGASVDMLPSQQFCWTEQGRDLMQPGQNWNGSVYLWPPNDPAQFVREMYIAGPLQHLQNAQLVGGEDLQKLAEQQARLAGQGATARVTRLRYSYEHNGVKWEEDVYVTITLAAPTPLLQMWWCSGFAMRAPAGQLEKTSPLMLASLQSVRMTLDWTAVLEQCRQMLRANVRGQLEDSVKLGQMWREHREQLRQTWRQVYEERDAARERQNFAFRENLGGIETYNNPYESRSIELPQGYRDYWVNNQGQYVLSMDAGYNPNDGSTQEWRKMERHRP